MCLKIDVLRVSARRISRPLNNHTVRRGLEVRYSRLVSRTLAFHFPSMAPLFMSTSNHGNADRLTSLVPLDVRFAETLFIHVPKTGGSSVLGAFGEENRTLLKTPGEAVRYAESREPVSGCLSLNHLSLSWALRAGILNEKSSKHLKVFAAVRNPYKRIESVYWHLRRKNQLRFLRTFDSFIDFIYRRGVWPIGPWDHFGASFANPQVAWTRGWPRPVHLLRTESLTEDFKNLFGGPLQGLPALPHLNVSVHSHEISWTERSVERVRDLYDEDFREFGYPDAPPQEIKLRH